MYTEYERNHMTNLLERAGAGDPQAKFDLIRFTHANIVAIARKLLRGYPRLREEPEAMVNEAYFRLDRALRATRPSTPEKFFGLAKLQIERVLHDEMRKLDGRGLTPRPLAASFPTGEDSGALEPAAEHDPSYVSRRMDVEDMLDLLPKAEKAVARLVLKQGYTIPEAADDLGIHPDTVKRRLKRAKEKLVRWLRDRRPCAV